MQSDLSDDLPNDRGPWWGRFTPLQLVIATAILLVGLAGLWILASGDMRLLIECTGGGYLLVIGLWATRRVAAALAAVLEERSGYLVSGPYAIGRVLEAAMLPLYCAAVLLVVVVVAGGLPDLRAGPILVELYGMLSYVGIGALGMIASAITMLSIWRRQSSAGWIAVIVAQVVGAATVAAGFYLAMPDWGPLDRADTWYAHTMGPAALWLIFVAMSVLLGLVAMFRLWDLVERDGIVPWVTLLFLVVFIGFLAGVGRLTGGWLSSWLYGAFMMARLATYAVFLFEPKDRPVWSSGWFACYLAAVVTCIAATAHTIATGNFAMLMQPLLMSPLPPIEMFGSPWGFAPSLLLSLTRDILLLLWLARWRPGWGEALGVAVLALLYWPLAIGLAVLGWTFLFPVFYPLFIAGLVDAIWPLGMIAVLVALNLRVRRDLPATTSLA